MRLRTTFDLFAWYERVRGLGMPVAWCSAFAPAEALLALGVVPVYPENHAAMLGALSEDRNPDRPYSRAAIAGAEAIGLSSPRLCAYALADLGVLAGAPSPLGSLPSPDLFYACDSQCAVVARWGDEVQRMVRSREGREVPQYVLTAPPLTRAETHTAEERAGFAGQLNGHLDDIAGRFGLRRDPDRLREVVRESAEANRLWQRCLALGAKRPAPWTSFDDFTAMAPIVVARGFPECTDFYRRLLAELEERVQGGVAAVPGERLRLLWDAIPIWPRKNWLARFLSERGVAVVVSTYTHSWWFAFEVEQPFDSLVNRYAWNTMNRSGRWVLDWTLGLVTEYHCQGILSHWNRSCGIWNSFVKRRLPGFAEAGVATLLIEADMVDARAFDEALVAERLERFLGELGCRA